MDQEQIAARLAGLEAEQARLRGVVDLDVDDASPGVDEPPSGLAFRTIDEFVNGFVITHYELPSSSEGDIKWHQCWGEHPSVIWAMEILWGSFEEARAADLHGGGGTNSAAWTIGTFIPLMEWITATTGPFRLCGPRTCVGAGRLGQVPTYPPGPGRLGQIPTYPTGPARFGVPA